jgi:hypothetical protein
MSVRDDLAAALSSVPGVTGSPIRPRAAKTGNGWPRWAGAERDQGVLADSWHVLILVPDDARAQDQWIADHLQSLVEAITPVAYIEEIGFLEGEPSATLQFTVRE